MRPEPVKRGPAPLDLTPSRPPPTLGLVSHDGLEIERKFLLQAAPSAALLRAAGDRPVEIEQVYLAETTPGEARRVRHVRRDGRSSFRYTEKRALSGIVREEREREIDVAEHARLLAEADPERRPIRKTRHVFDYAGHTLELDVFEGDLAGLVLLEVELDAEDEEAALPPWLGPAIDVSEDVRYFNVNLARRETKRP